jgi:organic radical activating enzyme
VVITGGEPSLQIDDALVERLHQEGYYVAIETNGTHALPASIDWVTWSPKDQFAPNVPPLALARINEVKVVFDGKHNAEQYVSMAADAYLCLQPCDTGDMAHNQQIIQQCVDYILQHPHWHLSLQTHKFLNIR